MLAFNEVLEKGPVLAEHSAVQDRKPAEAIERHYEVLRRADRIVRVVYGAT